MIQHLLTERLFSTIFENPNFTRRNVIAAEIEKVIDALMRRSFSRADFMKRLDRYYLAIETYAKTITNWNEKQEFLNTVYERFFQGYSTKQADTHGVVYTPQPIVNFMLASVEHLLQTEFGSSLSAPGVNVLDPCTGTGNYLVNLMRHHISRRDMERKYASELFANEIMLLPYYIASLNIEHAYYELMGEYAPFEGLCFADTLTLAEGEQGSLFVEENAERTKRQKETPITVIIGNPPYNVGQVNENDNNKNRAYKEVDKQIAATYAKASKASLKAQLYDAYVKFFRWATGRLNGQDGIVCFVSNNSFLEQIAFDGMRKLLTEDFTTIYHLDCGGNVRKNPKLSGSTHNVFGIQVGVGITILIRRQKEDAKTQIFYYAMGETDRATEKLAELEKRGSIAGVTWQVLTPDAKQNWLTDKLEADFDTLIPLGTKEAKAGKFDANAIFHTYCLGVKTGRDNIVYDFDKAKLTIRMKQAIEDYNAEVARWTRAGKPKDIDNFVGYDKVKWSEHLKNELSRERTIEFDPNKIKRAIYRPFTKRWLYLDGTMNDRPALFNRVFPLRVIEEDNCVIWLKTGSEVPLFVLTTDITPDLLPQGGSQCFPFYVYDLGEDGNVVGRRENITDWALQQFQAAHGPDVTKWRIFHYVYALLHSPAYRTRYAENLKRELPRIPPSPPAPLPPSSAAQTGRGETDSHVPGSAQAERDAQRPETLSPLPPNSFGNQGEGPGVRVAPADAFLRYAEIGAKLLALHRDYDTAPEYRLQAIENCDIPYQWRVEKMKLSKDRTQIVVNESLTLGGIPPAAFQYRLGNRSALEWVIDQYAVSTDKRSALASDPNRDEAKDYIVSLIGKVITVSLETMRLVGELENSAAL